jgi:hypothetical protein
MRTFQNLLWIVVVLSIFAFSGCNENVSDPGLDNSNQASLSKIDHSVSVGGCDQVPPGEDRNFSLVATMNSDGQVSGQWQDGFGGGTGSIHVAVDCMIMVGDNAAIVGGVITNGTVNGVDVSGQRAVTAILDGGEGNNADPDQISYSLIGPNLTCSTFDFQQFPLSDINCGQVQVK